MKKKCFYRSDAVMTLGLRKNIKLLKLFIFGKVFAVRNHTKLSELYPRIRNNFKLSDQSDLVATTVNRRNNVDASRTPLTYLYFVDALEMTLDSLSKFIFASEIILDQQKAKRNREEDKSTRDQRHGVARLSSMITSQTLTALGERQIHMRTRSAHVTFPPQWRIGRRDKYSDWN